MYCIYFGLEYRYHLKGIKRTQTQQNVAYAENAIRILLSC